MAYTDLALAERRCIATTRAGAPCRRCACWGDVRCWNHGGKNRIQSKAGFEHTRYPPCRCSAYSFPHRPGSGGCQWPKTTPLYEDPTPQGKRRFGKQIR